MDNAGSVSCSAPLAYYAMFSFSSKHSIIIVVFSDKTACIKAAGMAPPGVTVRSLPLLPFQQA
jgi:hypothetical protein